MAEQCVFCDVISGKLPSRKAYEDRLFVAFHDRHPKAPVHVLVVPKRHVQSVADLKITPSDQRMLGGMMMLARHVALELGLKDSGYRLVINTGLDAGQAVPHLHVHVLGGRPMEWPPG